MSSPENADRRTWSGIPTPLAGEVPWRSIVEELGDIVSLHEQDGRARYVSPSITRALGHLPEALIGRHLFDLVHPDDVGALQEQFLRLLQKLPVPAPTCSRFRHADGRWVYLEGLGRNLVDCPGVNGILLVARDVTEQRRATEALRESEARNRALIEAIPDQIFVLDRTGAFLDWQEGRGRTETPILFLGQDVRGRRIDDVMPSICEPLHARLAGLFETGEPQACEHALPVEGAMRHFEARLVRLDEDRALCIVREITDRKQVETSLHQQQQWLSALMQSIPVPVFAKDRAGRYTYVNRPFEEFMGVPAAKIIGRTVFECWPGSDARVYHQRDLELMNRGGRQNYEHRLQHGSGEFRDVIYTKASYGGADGAIIGLVGTFLDITELRRAEETLRVSERKYRELAELLPQAVYETDPEGRLTFANQRGLAMFGYEIEDLAKGLTIFDLILPEEHPRVRANIARRLAGETGEGREYTALRKDGSTFPTMIYAELIREEKGFRGFRGIVVDLTAHHQTEQALRKAGQRDKLYFEQTPLGVIEWDPDFRVRRWNPAAEAIFGFPAAEAIGQNGSFILPPAVQGHINGLWKGLLAGQGGDRSSNENVRRDGQRILCEWYNTRLVDEAGRLVGVISLVHDITRRHRAEEALRENEAGLRLVVDNARDMISRHRPDSTILFVSSACFSLLGYRAEELHGLSADSLVHPADRSTTRTIVRKALEARQDAYLLEQRLRRKAGDYVWVETNGRLLYDEERMLKEIQCSVRDITERKRTEQERLEMERRLMHAQKLESLGVLAGGIAHDFNNLLTAILGNLELSLMDTSETSPPYEGIVAASLAARRAADLTRQMLAYSGRGRFVVRQVDLDGVVEEMAGLLRISISKSAVLQLQLDRKLPWIEADLVQIQQIVMNLITNASEAIGDRVGSITIRTSHEDYAAATLEESCLGEKCPPGRYVCLEVIDTGCGMDTNTRQRLFDPFYTTKFAGRGLGMAVVLGVVRGHRGAILLSSQPGAGTRIRVLFPAVLAPVSVAASGAPELPGSPPAAVIPQAGTILVVDDEKPVRLLLERTLARANFQVLLAADGRRAVDLYREHADRIDCVVLDLTMPEMDGLQTYQELRQIRAGVTVVLASGYDEQEVQDRFAGHDVAGFIQKPFDREALLAVIQGAVQSRRVTPPGSS